MRKFITVLSCLAAIALFVVLLPTPDDTSQQQTTQRNTSFVLPENGRYRLTNITLFDGMQWHESASLLVDAGRIVSPDAGQTTSEAMQEIDGQGGIVIPGLIDAHTHSWGNALDQALSFGVTTSLDMFTDLSFFLSKKPQRAQNIPVSEGDLFSSGILVTSPGGHGTEYGFTIPTISSPDEAETFVANRLSEGADYIKIVYDATAGQPGSFSQYTSIDYATLNAVIQAAHQQQVLAVVHVMDSTSAEDAVKAGADGLVHTFANGPASDVLIAAMKAQDVFVVPTLSILASVAGEGRGRAMIENSPFSGRLPGAIESAIDNDINVSGLPDDYFLTALNNTRRMHEAGITILAGTDAPNQGTAHGISLHDELALLVESGLSPAEALQAATYGPFSRFNIGERGHLKPGAKADFIVLNKDPRKDITHTQTIRHIVKNGAKVPAYFERTKNIGSTPSTGEISNFDTDLTPVTGKRFVTSSDNIMGGNSSATLHHIENGCNGNGVLSVKGEVGNQFPFPWAGALLMFNESMDNGYNLSQFKRIVFDARGTEGTFRLMVMMPGNPRPQERTFAVSAKCERISIELADFTGVDWTSITGIGWMAGATTTPFTLELDNIAFE